MPQADNTHQSDARHRLSLSIAKVLIRPDHAGPALLEAGHCNESVHEVAAARSPPGAAYLSNSMRDYLNTFRIAACVMPAGCAASLLLLELLTAADRSGYLTCESRGASWGKLAALRRL